MFSIYARVSWGELAIGAFEKCPVAGRVKRKNGVKTVKFGKSGEICLNVRKLLKTHLKRSLKILTDAHCTGRFETQSAPESICRFAIFI